MRDLVFLHDDNGTYIDYSLNAKDYLRDNFTVDYVEAEDRILLGLRKPFYQNYIEMNTEAAGLTLSFKHSETATFTSFSHSDDTNNLERSGFVFYPKSIFDSWEPQTIDGQELYWIEIKLGIDFSLDVTAWNMLFSDDNDLRAEVRVVDKYLAKGDSTFVAYQLAARNEILQNLRNGGNATRVTGTTELNNLDQWDLLKPEEVRQASKYLTLSKIFFDSSTEIEDKNYQKHIDYKNEFGAAFKLFYRSIDSNDDGTLETSENLACRTITLRKV